MQREVRCIGQIYFSCSSCQFSDTVWLPLVMYVYTYVHTSMSMLKLCLEWFYSQSKTKREVQRCPTHSLHPHMHKNGAFFLTKDELARTHHHHPKSRAYVRVHSWWCTFCGFGQTCNDMCPSLQCHAKYFHCPKDALCSTCSSLPPPSARPL